MNPELIPMTDLLPQRPPMVMLDRIIHFDGTFTRGILLIREDNVFAREGKFMESGMLEAMAQTAAARTSLAQRALPGAGTRPPQIGVIGSIQNFRLNFLPDCGSSIETEIELVHEVMNASMIKGRVLSEGKQACSAELKIFLTETNPRS